MPRSPSSRNSSVNATEDKTRYAIVTGSAGTLGRAFAVRLAERGYRLALVDINEPENAETLRLVELAGGSGFTARVDVSSAAAWTELHDRLAREWPRVDLLVNNAGVAASGEVGLMSLADWEWLLAINLKSVVLGCHTFAERLKTNAGGAHVINVASFAAFACLPNMAAYNVAKAGVLALSETLRIEWHRHRVGFTVVCPSFFTSGLLDAGRFHTDSQRDYTQREMSEAGFTADDVASAALRAMDRKRFYVVMPRKAKLFWWLKRFVPNLFMKEITRRFELQPKTANETSTPAKPDAQS
jgi:NAD(P)-dependent dehydrogenase (short-subunit alcohol dehydrogenase family)